MKDCTRKIHCELVGGPRDGERMIVMAMPDGGPPNAIEFYRQSPNFDFAKQGFLDVLHMEQIQEPEKVYYYLYKLRTDGENYVAYYRWHELQDEGTA